MTPQQRRRGLAGALLDDGLGWARSQGCTRILLEVRDDNTTAQQLYRSRGFDVLSRRPGMVFSRDQLLAELWGPTTVAPVEQAPEPAAAPVA